MAPSPRKNVSAATAVVILLVIVTAEMMAPVAGSDDACSCRHLSGTYNGLCWGNCDLACKTESQDNIRGACDDFPSRCYCYTKCSP
ncbi:unnamed protein product [Urochloa decumbens]|uniref:Knottin scorpion toxin-like domain-containing protein n=1 Tax=Urochloa decumbens TaxID=240449 RepID=A0ABC9BT37_9POAL